MGMMKSWPLYRGSRTEFRRYFRYGFFYQSEMEIMVYILFLIATPRVLWYLEG